jgi:hypothetical protein
VINAIQHHTHLDFIFLAKHNTHLSEGKTNTHSALGEKLLSIPSVVVALDKFAFVSSDLDFIFEGTYLVF